MTDTHLLAAGEAARAIGITAAAVSKAISSGRLPYVEKTQNSYLIDPVVLFDVYRDKVNQKPDQNRPDFSDDSNAQLEIMHLHIAKAKLESEVTSLRAQLHLERKRGDTAEADRDAWRKLGMPLSNIDA